MAEDRNDVVSDPEGSRFVYGEDGEEAQLVYRLSGDRLVLTHTEVPESLGGRGVGGRLVAAAVAHARDNSQTIAPWCSFARKWLQDHPDDVGDLSVDWSEPPS